MLVLILHNVNKLVIARRVELHVQMWFGEYHRMGTVEATDLLYIFQSRLFWFESLLCLSIFFTIRCLSSASDLLKLIKRQSPPCPSDLYSNELHAYFYTTKTFQPTKMRKAGDRWGESPTGTHTMVLLTPTKFIEYSVLIFYQVINLKGLQSLAFKSWRRK